MQTIFLDNITAYPHYLVDKNIAPVIVASGIGHIAEKIVEIAGENKVPIYEDTILLP